MAAGRARAMPNRSNDLATSRCGDSPTLLESGGRNRGNYPLGPLLGADVNTGGAASAAVERRRLPEQLGREVASQPQTATLATKRSVALKARALGQRATGDGQ
jgi:hypothetical protein